MAMARLLNTAREIEDGILVLLFGALFSLSTLQILLRPFGLPLLGLDAILRHLVLWVGLWGSSIAMRQGHHFTIDLVPRLFPTRFHRIFKTASHIATALICAILCWQSIRFVDDERAFNTFRLLDVEGFYFQLIFPCVFFLITVRSVGHTNQLLRSTPNSN
jgi:TRAP-type C4-dicarboxylate transport system permease small subunit